VATHPLQAPLAYAKLNVVAKVEKIVRKTPEPQVTATKSAGREAPLFGERLPDALLNALHTNNRINQYLIENIDPAAWRAKPPGGKGRTIAAIVAHMHNVRVMWLKVSARGSEIPGQLDRARVNPTQARHAMDQSCQALSELIGHSLAGDGRVKGFRPDVAGFLGYLIAHDVHHRGQIAMLTRQLGHPLPQKVIFGMWEWNSR